MEAEASPPDAFVVRETSYENDGVAMSEYAFDEETDEDEGQESQGHNTPDPVRKRLRELEKLNKKQAQDLAERDKRLAGFQVRDVLSEYGITEKRDLERVPRWLEADGINPSDKSAVDAWLAENGDAFGYKPSVPEGQEEAKLGMERIAAAESQGTSSSQEAEIQAAIKGAATQEEMADLLVKYAHIKA